MIRRGLPAAGIAGVIAIALVGCTPDAAPPLSSSAEKVCANLIGVASAAADPSRTGNRSEFGDDSNLLQANSLYETSWGVRLSALRGNYPAKLDKDAATKWLLSELSRAVSRQGEFVASPVEGIRDSLQGLAALGDIDQVRGNPLQAFQSGWGYTDTPGGQPDTDTTAIAIEALELLKLRPPESLLSHLTSGVSKPNAEDSLSTVVDADIPSLQMLSMFDSAAAMKAAVPGLQRELDEWNRSLIASGAGGVQLGALEAVHDIAAREGIPVPAVPRSWANTLKAPGGFLALSKGGAGDPQVTYVAMKMGLLSRSAPMPVLASGVTPSGWLVASKPTIASFYDVSALHAVCHSPLSGEHTQLAHWTNQVLAESHPTAGSVYQTCSLQAIYHHHLSTPQTSELRKDARAALAEVEKDISASTQLLAQADVAAAACGVKLNPHAIPTVRSGVGPTSTSLDAFGEFVLASGGTQHRYSADISQFLNSTRSGSGYRYQTGEHEADVYSTAIALDMLGSSNRARTAALKDFRSQGSWAVETPDHANPQPGATLGSLLAVAFLVTGISTNSLCPLFIN